VVRNVERRRRNASLFDGRCGRRLGGWGRCSRFGRRRVRGLHLALLLGLRRPLVFPLLVLPLGRVEQPLNTTVNYSIVPVGLASSVRINPWVSLHLGGQFTWTETFGGSQPADSDIRGMAVLNLFQLWGMTEWRLSRVTAFTLTVRWVPYVSDVVVKTTVQVDPNTGAVIGIEVDVVDLTNAFAVVPGFVFSWDRANLRMGVGYGDFFVESMGGLVIPGKVLGNVTAELDVFVRF